MIQWGDEVEWKFSSDRAIYIQIVDKFVREIVSGRIEPGEKLPSVREIAEKAGVNPNTVQRAFSELEKTGMVYTSGTNGRYVTEETKLVQDAKVGMAKREIETFLKRMSSLGYKREQTIEVMKRYKEDENG